MTVNATARTDVGRVRARNEDSFLLDAGASLYAIADGMGGHAAGDVASQTAIAAFAAAFADTRSVLAAMKSANRAVIERAVAEPDKLGMGTTMTAVSIVGPSILAAHVGDSRLYRWRAHQLTQLTRDHTVVQDMVDRGALSKEEAMYHPMSSMLTRSLGSRADVEVDLLEDALQPGDLLLLCSDGLTGMMTDADIADVMQQGKALDDIAKELITRANRAGGIDNITVVLLQVESDS
ncbi:MAG TPA: Stp1/IreP family PP2C-type Ser/Thr phosphatase [Longimicrobiales bacterium]